MKEKFPTEPNPDVKNLLEQASRREKERSLEQVSRREKEFLSKGWQRLNVEPEPLKLDSDEAEEKLEGKYLRRYEKLGFYQADLVLKNEGAKKGPYFYDVYMRTPEAAQKEKEKQKEIRKELETAIGQLLKEKSFLKERSTWRRELKDLIDVFNLQKSQFSESYMINIGIFLREQDKSVTKPYAEDGLLSKRIEQLLPGEDWKTIRGALDFNLSPDLETARKQIEIIREAVEKYAIPFFESFESAEAVHDFLKKTHPRYAEK